MLGANSDTCLLKKKQLTITLSSSQAEYMGLSSTTRESTWLHKLIKDFGLKIPKPVHIYSNSKESINSRTKHIATHHHFTRERIEMGK